MSGPVSYTDRVFIVGKTGSGKSVFARHLFDRMTGARRVCIDPKGLERFPGVPAVRDPARIDPAAPLVHYIPAQLDRSEYEDLYETLWRQGGPCFIWLDEAMGGATEKNWAPQGLRLIVQQGRAHGIGHMAVSQRPVEVWPGLRTEAEHYFMFVPKPHPLNSQALSEVVSCSRPELEARYVDLHVREGDHSFLWYSVRDHELADCAPLPAPEGAGTCAQVPAPSHPPTKGV